MDLIKQLKKEHLEILRFFEVIKTDLSDSKSKNEDLIENLRELKNTLVSHLDLEDKMIYPALNKSKEKNTKELGEKFSKGMVEISKTTLAFFGKYMNENVSDLRKNSEFRKNLDEIIKAISKRIKIEEDVLYSTYEKITK